MNMVPKHPKDRASKGSVQIKGSNNRLQLVFSYGGKRHYLSLGFGDTPRNRKLAEMKDREIELDILSGHFDGIDKYKPQAILSSSVSISPAIGPKPNLDELWERYVDFKRPQVSQTTIARDYAKYRSHIAKLPDRSIDAAIQIRDYWVAYLTTNAAKRILTNISACCDWAVKSELIDKNPFKGMASEIKLQKHRDSELHDINIFSREERTRVMSLKSCVCGSNLPRSSCNALDYGPMLP